MKQYLDLCQRIVDEGKWVENTRTGKRCLTVINADLTYHVDKNEFPLVTTRKSYWKAAIAELLGYLRGYDSAAQFREIGCNTWNANANDNQDWLNNPNRKGEDDMGFVYGAVARNYPKPDGGSVDLVKQVIDDLSKGIDNRGEIITFWKKIPPKSLLKSKLLKFNSLLSKVKVSLKTSRYYQSSLQVSVGV
ncbi:hypothetical protein FLM44_12755 [Pseudoalteromonas luteoviolacea]|nr:thymidylate synthase [Pseudoalteromonas luteoviolacea]TQF71897.1 hypothetical protein FLM44_12755 [Pseudoalteromonas luteoviolacea]